MSVTSTLTADVSAGLPSTILAVSALTLGRCSRLA